MVVSTDATKLVGSYSNFDEYLASGNFAKLSDSDKILVYTHFQQSGRLESRVNRHKLILDARRSLDEEPLEDLGIIQPDGSRACANWELDARGFQLVN